MTYSGISYRMKIYCFDGLKNAFWQNIWVLTVEHPVSMMHEREGWEDSVIDISVVKFTQIEWLPGDCGITLLLSTPSNSLKLQHIKATFFNGSALEGNMI